jgi:hypothetical protein
MIYAGKKIAEANKPNPMQIGIITGDAIHATTPDTVTSDSKTGSPSPLPGVFAPLTNPIVIPIVIKKKDTIHDAIQNHNGNAQNTSFHFIV